MRRSCGLSPIRRKVVGNSRFVKAFGCHEYPSIRRAILPVQGRSMLAGLPAVVDVYINAIESHHFYTFVGVLATNCPVERLGWQVGHSAPTAGTCMLFTVLVVSISYWVQW